MRDATFEQSTTSTSCWRELYRCDDLRQARALAACIGAMEFDVRLHSTGPSRFHDANAGDEDLCGPHVIEVHESTWPQLADVLLEIITEQQEFDEMLEWRQQRKHARLVIVLSITTAAEVMLIWRLLEG
jgi:hypothetical protein